MRDNNVLVSQIQRFSLGDGRGIRTTVFFKGCNLHCAWCHNPETISEKPQILRYETEGKTVEKPCGVYMALEEIIKEALEDKDFYLHSGGGVTLSGGEPMLLPVDFLVELLRRIKNEGINTAVDTAGCVPAERFEKILPFTDTVLYDIKGLDAQSYREHTGGDFELVMRNLKFLIKNGADVRARLPVIPSYNCTAEYFKRAADILLNAGVKKADLLPYHRLGISKYKALGLDYKYEKTLPPPADLINEFAKILENSGFAVSVQ